MNTMVITLANTRSSINMYKWLYLSSRCQGVSWFEANYTYQYITMTCQGVSWFEANYTYQYIAMTWQGVSWFEATYTYQYITMTCQGPSFCCYSRIWSCWRIATRCILAFCYRQSFCERPPGRTLTCTVGTKRSWPWLRRGAALFPAGARESTRR